MILSKKYLKALVKKGLAQEVGEIKKDGILFMAVDRFDIQRVDHYEI